MLVKIQGDQIMKHHADNAGANDSAMVLSAIDWPEVADFANSFISPRGCYMADWALRSALHPEKGLVSEEMINLVKSSYSKNQCQGVFERSCAFDQVIASKDEDAIWGLLDQRTSEESSFLDLLVVGRFFWGERMSCGSYLKT